jgi:hypothetical protein
VIRYIRALPKALWPPRALRLHIRVTLWLVWAYVLYRRLPLDSFFAAWTPRGPGRRTNRSGDVVDTIDRVLLGVRRRRCFARSLMIYRMLRMQGEDLSICIGVKPGPDGEGLLGHAWLENGHGGGVYPYGDDGSTYYVTFRYPRGDAQP